MAEQGFAMQHRSLVDSALTTRRAGLNLGLGVASFPRRPAANPPTGDAPDTSILPVFPRLVVAWVGDDWSLGLSGLPPIGADGARVWTLAVAGAMTRPLGGWTGGLEGDVSYLSLRSDDDLGYRLANPAARLGIARPLGPATPYGKVGFTYLNERLVLEGTTWQLQTPQLSGHVGASLALGERWTLAGGSSAAWKTAATQEEGSARLLVAFEGAIAVGL